MEPYRHVLEVILTKWLVHPRNVHRAGLAVQLTNTQQAINKVRKARIVVILSYLLYEHADIV